jgi:predicted DNA binding CopG/RHH family protein
LRVEKSAAEACTDWAEVFGNKSPTAGFSAAAFADVTYVKLRETFQNFGTRLEERRFWETHDCSNYVDSSKSERVRLPNLKPSTTSSSLRLPASLLERIRVAANKRDVPYQSLIKIWLAEKTETPPQ